MGSCCGTTPKDLKMASTGAQSLPIQASSQALEFISVPGGQFLMGSNDPDANVLDSEGPIRSIDLAGFEISSTPVTNQQFAFFVSQTNFQTEAESLGWSFVFHLLVSEGSEVIGKSQGSEWWYAVTGANWRAPKGPGSSYTEALDHPVVHVSHNDALAYCEWANYQLPSEQQWEKAARGGLVSNRYPWGNSLLVEGQWQCNIFQGVFPESNSADDGFTGTSPVKSFPANGYGGYDFAGNVWEWTKTNFEAEGVIPTVGLKVTRGGSYLCHDSYCNRYRVGARNRTDINSSSGNIGFRVVKS
jgi:formylglycine-generating enzyme